MKIRIILIVTLLFSSVHAMDLQQKLSQKVSPQFDGASITEVLRLFSRQYAINMVVGDGVTGRVSVQLSDVTLADAINSILKSKGYHYVIENDVLLVKAFGDDVNGELQSKVFQLSYLNAYHLMETVSPMLSEKGKITPLMAQSEKEESDLRSNILVVTDLWENIKNIEQVIRSLDVPQQQIHIEVRLVESLLSDEQQYGLNLPKSVSVSMDGAETTAPITKGSDQGDTRLLSAWYKLPDAGENMNLGVLTVDQLSATLDMLARDNGSRLVSNPKVTTLNNRKASIRIGTTVPVPEVSRGIAGDLITFREKDVNINLDVIPQIGEDGQITLQVHPMMEEIIGFTGGSDTPQPITSKREVETVVTVLDNQTLVLGGLIKETRNKTVEKLWLLGDIPVLGYLFQNTSTKVEKSDLLIFITPKIVGYAAEER